MYRTRLRDILDRIYLTNITKGQHSKCPGAWPLPRQMLKALCELGVRKVISVRLLCQYDIHTNYGKMNRSRLRNAHVIGTNVGSSQDRACIYNLLCSPSPCDVLKMEDLIRQALGGYPTHGDCWCQGCLKRAVCAMHFITKTNHVIHSCEVNHI